MVHNQIVALFYMFYISSALIVAGRDTAATVWRGAFLRTKLAVILVELLWNAWHPAALPVKAVAAALLLSVLANGVNYLGAYGLLPADLATFDAPFSFGLHVIAQVAAIPINQLGNVFVLREQKSQARYRMAAWIIALAVSTVVLVQPWSAAAPVTLLLASAPSLLILTMLARQHPQCCIRSACTLSVVHATAHAVPVPHLRESTRALAHGFARPALQEVALAPGAIPAIFHAPGLQHPGPGLIERFWVLEPRRPDVVDRRLFFAPLDLPANAVRQRSLGSRRARDSSVEVAAVRTHQPP